MRGAHGVRPARSVQVGPTHWPGCLLSHGDDDEAAIISMPLGMNGDQSTQHVLVPYRAEQGGTDDVVNVVDFEHHHNQKVESRSFYGSAPITGSWASWARSTWPTNRFFSHPSGLSGPWRHLPKQKECLSVLSRPDRQCYTKLLFDDYPIVWLDLGFATRVLPAGGPPVLKMDEPASLALPPPA
jgi:hypothetical protein